VSGLCAHRPDGIGLAGDTASPIHRLDPRAKIVGLLAVTVVAVSTPAELWPVYAVCGAVLAAVAAVGRIGPGVVWRRARIVLPFVVLAAAFLPFVRRGGATVEFGPFTLSEAGLAIFAAVTAKAAIGTVSAVLLGATTTFPDTLRGLERLRVPRLLTLVAAFMYRYLFVVVDEVQRMRAALAARGYRPRHALHARPVGRAASSLFLRTYSRGERVYSAMLARGYTGAVPALRPLQAGRADAVFLAAVALPLLAVRLSAGLAA
jgi:cobalt/nickel transport system permease protein